MRRIITGHNDKGKSIVTIDGPPARSIGEDVGGLFELWNTDGNEVISSDVMNVYAIVLAQLATPPRASTDTLKEIGMVCCHDCVSRVDRLMSVINSF